MIRGWLASLIVHVTLVALTGFERNMNHIVLGTDNLRSLGMILGFAGIAVVIATWVVAHYTSWKFPRLDMGAAFMLYAQGLLFFLLP